MESCLHSHKKKNVQLDAPFGGETAKFPPDPNLVDPFNCVAEELDLVEEALAESIKSRESALTEIASHLIHSGGKRVRPMVTLLAFKTFGGTKTQDVVEIAASMELIHTATLLHDDIIDGAEIRRGKISAYKKFGLKSTLVAGDFLFIKAFEFAGKFDETVVQWTADACAKLTEGEILQNSFNRNRAVTLLDYFEIIKRKTASLFQTGAKLGAYLAGASPAHIELLSQYGLNLGMAFQMIDDVLDVVGHKELLGKPTGMDLRDGNPSLPIVLALDNDEKEVRETFECYQPSEDSIQKAIECIVKGKSIQQAKKFSKQYALKASKSIEMLPPSMHDNGLRDLVRLIVERDF